MRTITRLAALLVCTLATSAWGAEENLLAEAGYGYYVQYCAICHGSSGKGDGPLAEDLKSPPTDLTKITETHGTFPEPLLVEIIDGRRRVVGHGTHEMPIWGREFSRETGEHTGGDLAVRARVRLLIEYLRSIQIK